MAVNFVVAAVTLLMGGFVLAWLLLPRVRTWLEAPKYHFLESERRFPPVVRESPAHEGPSCLPTRLEKGARL